MTHYHLVGIGGTGLSAIARVLFERGDTVSGSDMIMSPAAEDLMKLGVEVFSGHDERNITNADIILRSSAIEDSNPEVAAALKAGIPVLKRRDFLHELTAEKKVIAIAGTHGKTTTTAMTAWCLAKCGFQPSYVIGSDAKNLGNNAAAGEGDYFVIEADEYDNMFLGLRPYILIITNIEHDHPDCFPTEKVYREAFAKLASQIEEKGYLIACNDDAGVRKLIGVIEGDKNVITYGQAEESDVRISAIQHKADVGVQFELHAGSGQALRGFDGNVSLKVPGEHNALNAAAAMTACNLISADRPCVTSALSEFSGTGRRFDILGEVQGITIIDDYGHHPTEIRKTLAGARKLYPARRIWAVWQPHTYSRTKELFEQFTQAFSDSDSVIVTEIYRSREKQEAYSSVSVVEEMPHPDKHFIPTLKATTDYLKSNLDRGDVLIVFSAGDANEITKNIVQFLRDTGETND